MWFKIFICSGKILNESFVFVACKIQFLSLTCFNPKTCPNSWIITFKKSIFTNLIWVNIDAELIIPFLEYKNSVTPIVLFFFCLTLKFISRTFAYMMIELSMASIFKNSE